MRMSITGPITRVLPVVVNSIQAVLVQELHQILEENFSVFIIPDHDGEAPTPAIPSEADDQFGLVLAGRLPRLRHQLWPGQPVQGYDVTFGRHLEGEEDKMSEMRTQTVKVCSFMSPLGHVTH